MEVAFQATLDVADVRPAAMDADVANNVVHDQSLVQHVVSGARQGCALVRAVGNGIAIRRADLAAVSYVARIRRADLDGVGLGIVVILTTTARDSATDSRSDAAQGHARLTVARRDNVGTMNVPDAVGAFLRRLANH